MVLANQITSLSILVVLITSLLKRNCLKTCNLAASKMLKIQKGYLTPVEGIGDAPVKLHLRDGKEKEMYLLFNK